MPISRHISDIRRFIGTLDASKIINASKIHLSYRLSVILRKPIVWGMPYSISVEPVNYCNLACPECPAGLKQLTRPKQNIDPRLFSQILDQTASKLMYLMLYFQGEPYLHRHIFELIGAAVRRKVYTAVSTNAQLIDDDYAEKTVRSGLHRIIISMDGITREAYESYRRKGSLDKVLEAITCLRNQRDQLKSATPYIVVQFIVFGTNEHQLDEVRSFAKKAGADKVEIKTAQFYDVAYGNPLMPVSRRYSRYRKTEDGRYIIKNKLPDHCFRLWTGAVITASGDTVPCCFDKDAQMITGNMHVDSFRDIWKNEKYQEFRKSIFRDRKQYNMCRNCTET